MCPRYYETLKYARTRLPDRGRRGIEGEKEVSSSGEIVTRERTVAEVVVIVLLRNILS